MPPKSELSIRAAVMHCLARCAESEAPLCCLGEFLEKLGSMGWTGDDVRRVENVVLRLLGHLHETAIHQAPSQLKANRL